MLQLVVALVAAPVVVWLLVICIRQPLHVTLPVYAAVIPFGGALSVGPTRFGSLSSILGIVLGMGLVLQLARSRRTAVRLSATVPVWLLFLGAAGATVLWSVTPSATISGFQVLGSLAIVYVLVAVSPVDAAVLRRVENGLLIGGLLVTAYGVFQLLVLGGFPSDNPGVGIVPDGRFGNDLLGPNNEAVALLLPLAVALHRAVMATERPRRVLHTAAAAVVLGGIVMTGSRGGMLATLVLVVVFAFISPRGRTTIVAYATVGAAVMAVVFFANPAGLAEREVDATSSSGRTSIWRVALAACPQYCDFGSGWGTFPDVYAETQASVPDAEVLVGKGGSYEPHNVWVLVAIELGVVGLVLLAVALWLSFSEALKLPASLRAPPLSGLIGTVFAALFLSNLEFKFFWMSLMLVVISRNLTAAEAAGTADEATRSVATGRH